MTKVILVGCGDAPSWLRAPAFFNALGTKLNTLFTNLNKDYASSFGFKPRFEVVENIASDKPRTKSLQTYISQFPLIFMANLKEPHYLRDQTLKRLLTDPDGKELSIKQIAAVPLNNPTGSSYNFSTSGGAVRCRQFMITLRFEA